MAGSRKSPGLFFRLELLNAAARAPFRGRAGRGRESLAFAYVMFDNGEMPIRLDIMR
jgi:hypothetical protein